MRWLLCVIAVVTVVSPPLVAQDIGPAQGLRDHTEFRTLGRARQSLPWQKAEADNLISLGKHVIAPNDTYFSIIESYGIRADPNSIRLTRALNEDRFEVRSLPVDETLLVIINKQRAPLAVALDSDLKLLIDRRLITFDGKRRELDAWVTEKGDIRTQELYNGIFVAVQNFRRTGYALDRSVLRSTDQALRVVEDITRALTTERRLPNERERTVYEIVFEGLQQLFSLASNTDEAGTSVRVATISPEGRHIDGLNVCFSQALNLRIFRALNGHDQDPDWSCVTSFDNLSSPAERLFEKSLEFAIWATRDQHRVSEYRIISIEKNQTDGSFYYELAVR